MAAADLSVHKLDQIGLNLVGTYAPPERYTIDDGIIRLQPIAGTQKPDLLEGSGKVIPLGPTRLCQSLN